MKKHIVLEIGHTTIFANAFGDLETAAPKWLGQGKASTIEENLEQGVNEALKKLGEQLGAESEELEVEADFFYVHTLNLSSGEIKRLDDSFNSRTPSILTKARGGAVSLTTYEALVAMARMIAQEVGEVLILDVGGGSTDIFHSSQFSVLPQAVHYEDLGIYPPTEAFLHRVEGAEMVDRYGTDWREQLKPFPENAIEIALGRELTSYALDEALFRYCKRISLSENESTQALGAISRLRWVVGTGGALTQLPGGMELIKGSLKNCEPIIDQEELPILIDRNNLMASLGAIAADYRQGAWQLLQESLGIDS